VVLGGFGSDYILANGNDTVYGDDATNPSFSGSGNDYIVANGTATVLGEAGNDVILVADPIEGKAVYFSGGAGDDVLVGGLAGGEVLSGDSGNDVINSLGGNDYLYGGTGSDIFYLLGDVEPYDPSGGGGIDYVLDWQSNIITAEWDYIALPDAYDTSTIFSQVGADTYVFVPQGDTYYYIYVANANAADVQAHTYFTA
jgi:hypothetical protein